MRTGRVGNRSEDDLSPSLYIIVLGQARTIVSRHDFLSTKRVIFAFVICQVRVVTTWYLIGPPPIYGLARVFAVCPQALYPFGLTSSDLVL